MDEKQILELIDEFVAEEHRLRELARRDALTQEDERARLDRLEQALDQCWDLLRQRRARLSAGQDPGEARPRPTGEVEDYLQ
ncbi:DUF2630 domain-containing protein [Actinomadura craniellae]|uniref:DUF2630 domain-containing protein n=1 Tax=Actinomadura craniellae TaxID=2231787 RepID=A0A365H993_9ACTN|nr:DUF2630 family protein [Actinomadura craniellae]RAY15526.1 DUF2630 domain-containing protein [Actinomadura craniellae]